MKCKQNCNKKANLIVSWGYWDYESGIRRKAEWAVCDECGNELCRRLDGTRQVYNLTPCEKNS